MRESRPPGTGGRIPSECVCCVSVCESVVWYVHVCGVVCVRYAHVCSMCICVCGMCMCVVCACVVCTCMCVCMCGVKCNMFAH